MSNQSVLSDEITKLVDRLLVDAFTAGANGDDFDMLAANRAVAAAAVQAAREGQEPFIWAAESMEEKQLIDGRPRRVFWECVNGVGIPLYTAPLAAPVVPEGMVLVPADVFEFLRGAAPLDGVWFGDRHPTERGTFWWRKRLAAAPAPSQGNGGAA